MSRVIHSENTNTCKQARSSGQGNNVRCTEKCFRWCL